MCRTLPQRRGEGTAWCVGPCHKGGGSLVCRTAMYEGLEGEGLVCRTLPRGGGWGSLVCIGPTTRGGGAAWCVGLPRGVGGEIWCVGLCHEGLGVYLCVCRTLP